MWVFNLSVQVKASCLGKTLETMEGLTSPPGCFKKCSSLCIFTPTPPFFYLNGNPAWLCCETLLSCSCLFRQTGQVAAYLALMASATSGSRHNWSHASDPAEPLCAGVIPPAHQCCTSSIFQCTCYTLLSGELCFCSFLLSVVQ